MVAYSQSNGQVEVVNRDIVKGLQTKLDHIGGNFVDEVPSVLWFYRTVPWEAIGETPFNMIYRTEAVAPIEIGLESIRIGAYDDNNAERHALDHDLI